MDVGSVGHYSALNQMRMQVYCSRWCYGVCFCFFILAMSPKSIFNNCVDPLSKKNSMCYFGKIYVQER